MPTFDSLPDDQIVVLIYAYALNQAEEVPLGNVLDHVTDNDRAATD
jgi:hypothetical protein